ncbi:hypothetical protein [uncultured Marivita sp.]|uniref:hypothetical protein n=1 Tax=uncultured Marivita sp. TaxID=888080 RepID=UPI00261871EA|nr:hypothetical protein [uncultured Marivita sp.]
MRWSKAKRWALSTVFGLFVVLLGVPEAPAFPVEASLSQDIHRHDDLGASGGKASGHCHPGLDCSVPAALLLQPGAVYEPHFLKAVMQVGATERTELQPNNDPPPPRRRV